MGLERITDRIIADAMAEAKKLVESAGQRAAQIEAEGEAELLAERAKQEEKNRQTEERLQQNMTAMARSIERQMLLAVENEVAQELTKAAKQQILDMDTAEYFDFLADLYRSNAEQGDWEILLSQEDKARMPEEFIKRLNEINKSVTLSTDTIAKRGFVLRRGKIEINCTIDAVFEDKKNIIADIIAAVGRE